MTRTAAIDIGTNSTRLLVWDGAPVDRRLRTTRLGQGTDRHRLLAAEAIERTLGALREYRTALDELGVQAWRAVATSAVRDADNRDEFLAAAAQVLGGPVEMLGGEEEARLSFAGATASLPASAAPFLVLDIGGGSTELSLGGTDGPVAVRSLDVGSVRLSEAELHHDPPAPEELANTIAIVHAHLDDVLLEVPAMLDATTLVGVAGTITTVAAVELGLAAYDPARTHHMRLSRDAVEDVFRTLATEPLRDRVHNPGLPRDRADIIVGGCCILVAVMRRLKRDELIVSETDILDGLLTALAVGG